MYQVLSERFMPKRYMEEVATPTSEQDRGVPQRVDAEADSFLDLLADAERRPANQNRSDIIARYHAWIGGNSAASTALHGAWFNLGVELAAVGDKAGAIDAYRNALVLKPGFYPAAVNLGTALESADQPEAALAIWQQALQPEEARAALFDYRNRLAQASRLEQQNAAKVLHVSCTGPEKLPPVFDNPGWQEIRLDINPAVRSDFVAGLTDMDSVSDSTIDAVYVPHAINHLCPQEVPLALREMHRVLKPTGFTLITLPDLQEVARYVADGKLEDPLYVSAGGSIAPLDILYGPRLAIANGHAHLAPRTGFTSATLGAALIKAGFAAVMVQCEPSALCLTAIAFRSRPDEAQLAQAQAQVLPAANLAAVLYTEPD
jgi:hypothetical protein